MSLALLEIPYRPLTRDSLLEIPYWRLLTGSLLEIPYRFLTRDSLPSLLLSLSLSLFQQVVSGDRAMDLVVPDLPE